MNVRTTSSCRHRSHGPSLLAPRSARKRHPTSTLPARISPSRGGRRRRQAVPALTDEGNDRPMTTENARTLVLLETIFCRLRDRPGDPRQLLHRASSSPSPRSHSQDDPRRCDFRATIYLSTDKGEWGDRVRELIEEPLRTAAGRGSRTSASTRLHPPRDRIPGRRLDQGRLGEEPRASTLPSREQLFEAAHERRRALEALDHLLRVTINDDERHLASLAREESRRDRGPCTRRRARDLGRGPRPWTAWT